MIDGTLDILTGYKYILCIVLGLEKRIALSDLLAYERQSNTTESASLSEFPIREGGTSHSTLDNNNIKLSKSAEDEVKKPNRFFNFFQKNNKQGDKSTAR
jgi:hypothetical protein